MQGLSEHEREPATEHLSEGAAYKYGKARARYSGKARAIFSARLWPIRSDFPSPGISSTRFCPRVGLASHHTRFVKAGIIARVDGGFQCISEGFPYDSFKIIPIIFQIIIKLFRFVFDELLIILHCCLHQPIVSHVCPPVL